MAGTFQKSSLPKRPGAYFDFTTDPPSGAQVPSTGTIALAATHSWGPIGTVQTLDGPGDFLRVYKQGAVAPAFTNGYRAVSDAFRGEGLPGYGGAGRVLFYRLAGSSAAAASHAFSNGTAPAITLTGLYKGTLGNAITVTVVANLANPSTNADLVIYVNGSEVERFTYAKTNITDLAAQINGTTPYTAATASKWVAASAVTSGTALTAVTAVALTGGDDGTTLVAGDYTAAQTAFEPFRFSVFGFDGLTDSTVLAALKTWAANLQTKGKRFVTLVGGLAGESMATAVARSATFADPNFVNIGGGTFTDAIYGDLGTAQLVPRIAGIVAQRGEGAEITFARLAGVDVKVGNTESDIVNALAGGVVALSRDSNVDAPVRIELGITTFTDTTNVALPVAVFGQLKFIRVMGGIETELTEWAETNVIGKMGVSDATRQYVRAQTQKRLAAREAAGIILPGWSVDISQNPPPSPTDNFVALDYRVTFERGLQQVLNTVTVG